MLGAFPVVGLRDGAVLVVGVGCCLGSASISIATRFRGLSRIEGGIKVKEEFFFFHGFVHVGVGSSDRSGGGKNHFETGKEL